MEKLLNFNKFVNNSLLETSIQWGKRGTYRDKMYWNGSIEIKSNKRFYMYVVDDSIIDRVLQMKKHKPGEAFQFIQNQAELAFCKDDKKDEWTKMIRKNKLWKCSIKK